MERDAESFEDMLLEHEAKSDKLEKGRKVSGRIIAVTDEDAFVDIGGKQDGVIDRKELVGADGTDKAVIGETVEAFVVDISSQGVKLSRSMSGAGMAALEDALAAGIPVEGRVASACKGGYRVEVLGKTAFCPGSQMEISPTGNNDDLVGTHTQFLIMRIENHGHNIVVSRRALLDRQKQENLEALLPKIAPGSIVDGKVKRFAKFGAFIELAPGVEGMTHLSELAWTHVNTPEEALTLDEPVQAKVLSLENDDKGRMRIALSIKQAQEDPWQTVADKFSVGDIVEGTVVRFAPFGAFVEIAPGVEGLAHISEMAWGKRVNKPEDVVSPGEKVKVGIRDINPEARRISLSFKDALEDPWATAEARFAPGTTVTGTVESKSQHGLFVNLADGITGLLPNGALRKGSPELAKLNPGDQINLVVQNLDRDSRRISLMPLTAENAVKEDDSSWKSHTRTEDTAGMGIMAQALQNAIQKKRKGEGKA